jgi:hypothetical protein
MILIQSQMPAELQEANPARPGHNAPLVAYAVPIPQAERQEIPGKELITAVVSL